MAIITQHFMFEQPNALLDNFIKKCVYSLLNESQVHLLVTFIIRCISNTFAKLS